MMQIPIREASFPVRESKAELNQKLYVCEFKFITLVRFNRLYLCFKVIVSFHDTKFHFDWLPIPFGRIRRIIQDSSEDTNLFFINSTGNTLSTRCHSLAVTQP